MCVCVFIRSIVLSISLSSYVRQVTDLIFLHILFQPLIGQYPPPPPVATGPGLDRPIFPAAVPTPEHQLHASSTPGGGGSVTGQLSGPGGYTMMRTRKFYQDQQQQQQTGVGDGSASSVQGRSYSVESPVRRVSTGEQHGLDHNGAVNRGYR